MLCTTSNGMIDINPDEKIILKVRRHWFTLLSQIFSMAIISVLPIGFYFVFLANSHFLVIPGDSVYFLMAVEPMWALFIWILFCKFLMNYYLDVWVVTDKRVIDIKQNGFFNRQVSSMRLEKIQDITVTVKGILRSLLKFGEIRVQSAGEIEEFVMDNISNPYQVKETIVRLSDEALGKVPAGSQP